MPDCDPLDFEDIAIRHLAKRARQIHVRCGLISAVTGLVLGQLTAWFALEVAGALPGVVYGAVFLGPLLGSLVLGRGLAKKLILHRSRAWSNEMAEPYQLDAAQLRGYIDHM